jgi:hypothetical protein
MDPSLAENRGNMDSQRLLVSAPQGTQRRPIHRCIQRARPLRGPKLHFYGPICPSGAMCKSGRVRHLSKSIQSYDAAKAAPEAAFLFEPNSDFWPMCVGSESGKIALVCCCLCSSV